MGKKEPTKESNHGGVRPGAGRPKSRALEHLEELRTVEKKIVGALPDVIEKLISLAKEGDVAAARLLLERIWGRPPQAARPLAEDESDPPDDPVKLAEKEAEHKRREMFALLG